MKLNLEIKNESGIFHNKNDMLLMKSITNFLLIFIVLFSVGANIAGAKLTGNMTGIKGTSLMWMSPTTIIADIDKVSEIGLNSISVGIDPDYINAVRNGGADPYMAGFQYAHQKGLKVIIIMGFLSYVPSQNRADFRNNTAAQDQMITNVQWLIQHYAGYIDGIELEEPQIEDGKGELNRACWNAFFSRMQKTIETYAPSNFNFGFNTMANDPTNYYNEGIDVAYINANGLFTYMAPQAPRDINIVVADWEKVLPNLDIVPYIYVTWGTLLRAPACNYSWNVVACWNQNYFKDLRYLLANNISYTVFCEIFLLVPHRDMFPIESSIPGEHMWEMTQYTLNYHKSIPATTPIPTPTPTPTPVPNYSSPISNPGFESGTSSWIFYTNGIGALSIVSPGYGGNYTSQIVLNSTASNIQLYQREINLEPNTQYRLNFAAYSTTGHDLTVNLLKHDSPYTNYGLSFTPKIGTNWQTFMVEFNTSGFAGAVNDGRLMFFIGEFAAAGDKYYIDDVRLEKVENSIYDVNNDGIVNIYDLSIVSQHFDENTTVPYPAYDVNADGKVNFSDLILVGMNIN